MNHPLSSARLALFSLLFACPCSFLHAQRTVASDPSSNLIARLPEAPSALIDPAFQSSSSSSDQQPTQQTQPPAKTNPPAPGQNTASDDSSSQLKQEEQQRMLGVIPAFSTVFSGNAAPLTARQKYHLFFKSSIDPFQFVAAGVTAGLEQAQNSFPEYGQGFKGYAKRYGAAYADSFNGNFFGNAMLPALFHQDPRYFRSGQGSIPARLWYAILGSVRCKGDNGHWQFNYSNISGNFIGGAISNAYYPASDRGFGLTVQRSLVVTAEGAIGSTAVEFYPDVMARLFHHKRVVAPQPAQNATSQP
jgi:hypothetical protein